MKNTMTSSDRIAASIIVLAGAVALGFGSLAQATNGAFGEGTQTIGGILLILGGWPMFRDILRYWKKSTNPEDPNKTNA